MKRTLKILTLVTGIFVGTGSITIAHATEDAGIVAVEDAAVTPQEVPDAMAVVMAGAPTVATPVVPESADEALGLINQIAARLRLSEWLPAFALSLFIIVAGLRKWVFKRIDWFQSKTGGATLAFGTSFLLTGATMYLGGDGLNIGMITTAAGIAWAAAGKHGHAKDIAES